MAGLRRSRRWVNASKYVLCLVAVLVLAVSVSAQSPLTVTTTALPPGNTSNNYYYALSASGGTAPYTWQLAPGSALPGDPAKLTLSSSGIINGPLPTITPGMPPIAASFTVQVTDAAQNTASQTLSITVLPPGSHTLVFNQIYTGGNGSASATYNSDFLEVFNAGPVAIDLQNWTLQVASNAGNFDPTSSYPLGSLDAYTVGTTNYPAFQLTYSTAFTTSNCNPATGTPVNSAFPAGHCWLNPGQYFLIKINPSGSTNTTNNWSLPLIPDLDLTTGSVNVGAVAGSSNWIGHSGTAAKPNPGSGKLSLVNGITAGVTCPNSLNPAPTMVFSPLASDFVAYFAQVTAGTTAVNNCWEGPTETTITNPTGSKTVVNGGSAFYASSSNKNTESLVRSAGKGNGSGLEVDATQDPATWATPCGDSDNNYTDYVPMKIGSAGQTYSLLHNSQMQVAQTVANMITAVGTNSPNAVAYTAVPCTQVGGQPLNPVGPQVTASVDQSSVGLNQGSGSVTETITVKVVPSSNPTSVIFNVKADVSGIAGAQMPFTMKSIGVPDGTGAYVYTGTFNMPTDTVGTFDIPVTVMDDAYRWAVNANISDPLKVSVTVNAKCQAPTASPLSLQMNWNSVQSITLAGALGYSCGADDTLVYDIVDQPTNGTLGSVTGNALTYTPNAGFSGQDSFTYTVTDTSAPDGAITSSKATVSIAVSATGVTPQLALQCAPVTYDGASHGCTAVLTPFVVGTTAITYNGDTNAPAAAGTYAVSAAFTTADPSQNASASGSLVINPVTPTITLSCPTVSYDESAHGCTAQVTGINGAAVSGTTTITYNGSDTLPKDGGTYTVTATFVSNESNYSNTTANGSLTINVPTVTITAKDQSVVYGAALPTFSYTVSPSIYLTGAPTCTSSVSSTAGVGLYAGAITCSGAAKPGVNFAYAPGSLTITQGAAVVTANNQTMTVGGAVPELTFSVSPAGVTFNTAPTCTTTATSTSEVGPYPITCSGGDSPNYSLSYVSGTLNVIASSPVPNPVPVITTLSPAHAASGSGNTTVTITGAGFVQGSTIHWNGANRSTMFVSSTQLTATILASDLTATGTAEITIVSPAPAGGNSESMEFSIDSASNANGAFSVTTSGTFTVAHGKSMVVPLTWTNVVKGTPVSVLCYNLPIGSSCSFDSSTSTVTLTTASATPAGHYQVLIVCNTNPAQTAHANTRTAFHPVFYAALIIPFGMLTIGGSSRRKKMLLIIGLLCLLMVGMIGCGGGSKTETSQSPANTASAQASTTIALTVN